MTLSSIGELPLFKRRSGAEELEALLDLLPHPVLVANSLTGRVLFGNLQATRLSAYTRRELAELELTTLLPELTVSALEDPVSKKPQLQKLISRSSRFTSVAVKVDQLGGPDHWVALSLLPPAELEADPRALEQQRWEALHMLSLAAQQDDLASCFRQILAAGAMLTGASQLLLYTPGESELTLKLEAVAGAGADFPASLEAADFGHLRTPKIWQAGKPIESSLQKAAHSAKLAYLASTPLDITDPHSGLLAVASEAAPAPKDILTMLQILAATAATARLQAEVASALQGKTTRLAESEQINNTLQEHVQDGLLFADDQLRVLDLNPAAEAMLGYSTSEIIGRPANDVLISAQSILPALELALTEGKGFEIGERKLHRRDGTEFLAFLRVALVAAQGSPARLSVLFTDLSEHEAFHLQSQQLQQRAWLGEITAYFAHEVRNPINNISTGLQLMQISLPEQDPLQEQIKRLQEDCDRLEHRMKSVLSFSRNLEHHPEALDIGEFCGTQLDRWRPRMSRKNVSDHLQIAPDTPAIYGDRRALDQVFTNLITNAIQAMQDQDSGVLAMKIRPNPDDPKMVDVHISDNGPGIPEELRRRVFEPFFTTKHEEGTGLGLAITRRIIMMHKGSIELESFPGGTLFKIQLPVAPSAFIEGNSAE
ncbi:MAG: ATP-binding protein [Anaerolineales bacterium]